MNQRNQYKSPYPYFGGKSTVSEIVWERLGDAPNYIEPFFGSGAVLLQRPHFNSDFSGIETVNDLSGFIVNFWRAVKHAPNDVAKYADWPSFENDLHARHIWLVNQKDSLQLRLEGDPDFFDAKIAGWWVWGMAQWIGSGFCSGDGAWTSVDGVMTNGDGGRGVSRQRVHLGDGGQGVSRQRVHLGDGGQDTPGTGKCGIYAWMEALCDRFRRVRVCCGDWTRITGNTPTISNGLTGVFLDPPYADTANRDANLYEKDSLTVAHDVREWAIANGDNPKFRIALCGYELEHIMPESWECIAWKAKGGYGSQSASGNDNATRERIWFSPHCLKPHRQPQWEAMELFAAA